MVKPHTILKYLITLSLSKYFFAELANIAIKHCTARLTKNNTKTPKILSAIVRSKFVLHINAVKIGIVVGLASVSK